MQSPSLSKKNIWQKIMDRAIKFDEADLKANKMGQLSSSQQEFIQEVIEAKANNLRQSKKWLPILVLAFWVLIILSLLLPSNRDELESLLHGSWQTLATVLGLVVLLAFVTYFLTFLIDRHGKELKSVSGVIKKKEAYSRYGNIYYLKLRRKKFQVSHELYEKIESDQQYTFYYINNYLIDIIFSWEKL